MQFAIVPLKSCYQQDVSPFSCWCCILKSCVVLEIYPAFGSCFQSVGKWCRSLWRCGQSFGHVALMAKRLSGRQRRCRLAIDLGVDQWFAVKAKLANWYLNDFKFRVLYFSTFVLYVLYPFRFGFPEEKVMKSQDTTVYSSCLPRLPMSALTAPREPWWRYVMAARLQPGNLRPWFPGKMML